MRGLVLCGNFSANTHFTHGVLNYTQYYIQLQLSLFSRCRFQHLISTVCFYMLMSFGSIYIQEETHSAFVINLFLSSTFDIFYKLSKQHNAHNFQKTIIPNRSPYCTSYMYFGNPGCCCSAQVGKFFYSQLKCRDVIGVS